MRATKLICGLFVSGRTAGGDAAHPASNAYQDAKQPKQKKEKKEKEKRQPKHEPQSQAPDPTLYSDNVDDEEYEYIDAEVPTRHRMPPPTPNKAYY